MHRALCTLAMCCVFSSAGVAQVRPSPARAPTSAVWEYGQLFFVGMRDQPAIGPIWLSADTTLFGVLDSVAAQPTPPGRVGPATLIRLLNVLGAKGWELVGVPSRSGEPYVFKRQLSSAVGPLK